MRLAFLVALVGAIGSCSLARAPLTPATGVDGGLDARVGVDGGDDGGAEDGGPIDGGGNDGGGDGGGGGDPLGAVCSDGTTCLSGICADGVCCDSACDGDCESCTGGIDGRCSPSTVGSDPDDDCDVTPETSCGTTGVCDGAGACALHPSGTVCAPPSCAAGVQTLPSTCDGSGGCAGAGTRTCTGGCDGDVCAGSCSVDSMCGPGTFCRVATGDCIPLLADGSPSSVAAHCASGSVADGVCCETDCGGTCEACIAVLTGSADGRCRAAIGGTDPDGDCSAEAATTCGRTGECDGSGACELFASGAQCAPPSCALGTEAPADLCDGAGTCVDSGTASCGAYACGATACRTGCVVDGDCAPAHFCTGGGTCAAQRPNGATCGRGGECTSGVCADGVCCDRACGGTCEACTVALRGVGGADGTCGPIAAGNDPDSECAAMPASSCGTTGVCDGAAACARWPVGSVCGMPSCTGGSLENADTCDATGTCVDGGTTSCGAYACAVSGTACRTSCTGPSDCAFGASCDVGTMTCSIPGGNGSPCTMPSQCASTFCVDGVCCDGLCAGACSACTAALRGSGVDGTCGPIAAGTDPQNECPVDATSTCDRTGTCSGAGACELYAGGTPCSAASCAGSTFSGADLCDGSGTCVDSGNTSCAPFLCSGAACGTTCGSDAECVAAGWCEVAMTRCRPDQANGATCTSASQCASGNCVDGVCCNATCNGTCVSCAVSGSIGTCTNVPNATSDPGTCAAPSLCNGSGVCRAPNGTACTSGTTCLSGNCVDGFCCSSACTGTCMSCAVTGMIGTCANSPAGTTDAGTCSAPAVCNGSGACGRTNGTACTSDPQCLSGHCIDGVCCNSTCTGFCQACDVGGSLGTCVNVPDGMDPDSECLGGRVCDGAGGCRF